jgi:ribosomal protein S18 acetylase RimI-like enzyme
MTRTVPGEASAAAGGGGPEVRLVRVDRTLRDAVLALAPHAPQRRWSGVPADTLPPSERDDNQHPVAILADGAPVGFFVLHGGVSAGRFVRPRGELLLRAFFVDAAWQDRSVGSLALARLRDFVHALDPAVTRVVLTVNVENAHALHVYRRAGFVDTGERYQRPGGGPQYVMELVL